MRLPAVIVPAILLLAGAAWFFAGTKEAPPRRDAALDTPPPVAAQDVLADENDRQSIRQFLDLPVLSDLQVDILVRAAGRRYMRRKISYTAAVDSGKASPRALDFLRREMESARKVCDVAESLGHTRTMAASAQADFELERRLASMPYSQGLAERYNGTRAFTEADLDAMETSFHKTFGTSLPVSTRGESAVHRAMGFDHTGRFDLALSPTQPEGMWARQYLTGKGATFLAFRSAVPGKATGAHIHIGPPSTHRAPRS